MRRSARLREHSVKEPPPKRERRQPPVEKARPQYAYALENNVPVTESLPDYSLLDDPTSTEQSSLLAYSLYTSRQNWLACSMFTRYWQRRPRGQKLSRGETNVRDTMTKLCECSIEMGPHVFSARLFTVKDEAADKKAAEEAEKEAKAEAEKREKEAKAEAERKEKELELQKTRNAELAAQQEATTTVTNSSEAAIPAEKQVAANENASAQAVPSDSLASVNPRTLTDTNPESGMTNSQPVSVKVAESFPTSGSVKTENEHLPPTPPQSTGVGAHAAGGTPSQTETLQTTNLHNPTHGNQSPPGTLSEAPRKERLAEPEGLQQHSQEGLQAVPQESPQDAPPPSADSNAQTATLNKPPQFQHTFSEPAPTQAPIDPPAQASAPTPGERAVSNQMVVARLQKLAKRDQALNELMREVASGNAPPSTIARFQLYINKARAMDVGRKPPKTVTPKVSQTTTSAPSPVIKKPVKHIMLAFELDENPTERFLIDKQSIMELAGDGVALVSFLYVQRAKRQPPVYTPVTIAIRDLLPRVYGTLERCFSPQEEVREEMSKIIKEGIRSESRYVWQAVEKADAAMMEKVKKCGPPMQAAHMWRRLARAKNMAGNQATGSTGRQESKAKANNVIKKENYLDRTSLVSGHQTPGLQSGIHPPMTIGAGHMPLEIKIEPTSSAPTLVPVAGFAPQNSLVPAATTPVIERTSAVAQPVAQPVPALDFSLNAAHAVSGQIDDATTGTTTTTTIPTPAAPEVSRSVSPLDATSVTQSTTTLSQNSPASLVQPKLDLPSLDSFVFPQGEMPPLPPSMRRQSDNDAAKEID